MKSSPYGVFAVGVLGFWHEVFQSLGDARPKYIKYSTN